MYQLTAPMRIHLNRIADQRGVSPYVLMERALNMLERGDDDIYRLAETRRALKADLAAERAAAAALPKRRLFGIIPMN